MRFIIFFCFLISPLYANQAIINKINNYLSNGTIIVADDNKILLNYSKYNKKTYIPASVVKIPSVLSAFYYLGTDYQFKTNFYLTDDHTLIIKGFADPYLVSEEIALITDYLINHPYFPKKIKKIQIDDSKVISETLWQGGSNNPYHAINGALVVNFNTINITKNKYGTIQSAEPQTPLTPLAQKLGQNLGRGTHRINVGENYQNTLIYAHELFQAFLEQKHIIIQDKKLYTGKVPTNAYLIYSHKNSKNLQDAAQALLYYSNNFIANQIILTIALEKNPHQAASLEQGIYYVNQYLQTQLKLSNYDIHLVEGSGLSLQNTMTTEALLTILKTFYPYRGLLKEKDGVYYKSGTLSGVYNYAGYLKNKDPLYFIIFLHQSGNYRDSILNILEQGFKD